MAEANPVPAHGATPGQPPASFAEIVDVPAAGYRTAIAIKHDGRMTKAEVTFNLKEHTADSATYSALCPRCHAGEIAVAVKLKADGSFAEAPACPTLCLACEDRLDDILEPDRGPALEDQPQDRATLGKYLKAMSTRAWD